MQWLLPGQHAGQQFAEVAPVQEAPEGRLPGVAAELLPGGGDLDGLLPGFEAKLRSHRLVSVSLVALGCCFFLIPPASPKR